MTGVVIGAVFADDHGDMVEITNPEQYFSFLENSQKELVVVDFAGKYCYACQELTKL